MTLIASAKYQGKVLTTTAGQGHSFGYLNRGAFAKTDPDANINGYGGESRFWVGPEAGEASIFFAPGAPLEDEYWDTPDAIDLEAWEKLDQTPLSVRFGKSMRVENRLGTTFDLQLQREVQLVSPGASGTLPEGVSAVAYLLSDRITNVGTETWTPATGTVCTWNLGMLPASDSVVVVAPIVSADTANARGAIHAREYFGEVPAERMSTLFFSDGARRGGQTGAVLFRGDGRERGKFGLPNAISNGQIGAVDLERVGCPSTRRLPTPPIGTCLWPGNRGQAFSTVTW